MYFFGVLISFGGLIMTNAMGVKVSSANNCGSSYSYEFGTTATETPCTTFDFNYVQIALGVLCIVLCLTFICVVGRSIGWTRRAGYYRGMRRYNNW